VPSPSPLRIPPRLIATLWLLLACALALPAHAQQTVGHGPVLLVASPGLQDPNFAQSVVLVVFPQEGGPTGVILNQPTRLQWKDAFPDEPALAQRTDSIFFGGPVRVGALWFLFRQPLTPPTALPVVDDLCLSADGKLLDRLLESGGKVERFFVGYSGWAPSQLEFEIAQGAWYVLPANLKDILELTPEAMWRELLRRATAVEA
jgi:putative transcriptional regulator